MHLPFSNALPHQNLLLPPHSMLCFLSFAGRRKTARLR
jgi:hypothetical protein